MQSFVFSIHTPHHTTRNQPHQPTTPHTPHTNQPQAREDGLELVHWVKGYKDANGRVRDAHEGDYPFAKYNKKVGGLVGQLLCGWEGGCCVGVEWVDDASWGCGVSVAVSAVAWEL